MRVTVVRPSELGEGEAAQWRAFQGSSLIMSHPFLSLSYVKAWGMVTANARVAVVEDGGRIQAFIPYAIGDRKIAATVGGTHTSVDGIVSSGSPLDVRAVVRKSGLRGWRFSRAPVDQQALDPYRYRGARDWRTVSCINLAGDFDDYLSELRDGVRKRIVKAERSRRALERAAGPVRFDWRSPGTEHFDQLIEWKSAQYGNVGEWGPDVLSVIRELAFMNNDDCRGLMGVLFAGEKVAAISLNLEGPGIVAGWSMAYNPDLSKFSPGTIQLLDFIRDCAAHGIKMLDLGADFTAVNSFKDHYGNATFQLSGGGVWASRLGSAARSLYRAAKYRD